MVGGMSVDWWRRDPKRMAFVAARYKHVGRLLTGKYSVLEVGCADGFFSRIVRQHVGELTAIDIDVRSIGEALRFHTCEEWPINFMRHNILDGPLKRFDAAYALDVLEHMEPGDQEQAFLSSMRDAAPVCVLGAPSLESQEHASALSRAGHVNCMNEEDMRDALQMFWSHVFIFGMNDETLHTGFGPMCHYRLAICAR